MPVVYSPQNNIRFFGLEKLHPFDSCKYEKIIASLPFFRSPKFHKKTRNPASDYFYVQPSGPIHDSLLGLVHSQDYLQAVHSSSRKVAEVTELFPLAFLPAFINRDRVVNPMKTMVAGTCIATALAARYGSLLRQIRSFHNTVL